MSAAPVPPLSPVELRDLAELNAARELETRVARQRRDAEIARLVALRGATP